MPFDEKVRALVSGAQQMREGQYIRDDDFAKIIAYALYLEISSRIQPKFGRQNDRLSKLSDRMNERLNAAGLPR
ncbi:MAG: hypothetical protein OXG02_04355 [Chloroflexi bacterium]|nr:hypothetical protein [Chloroflexota bacterium]MCY4105917.1 hypothetical protein [Chloroflexota bacterium]